MKRRHYFALAMVGALVLWVGHNIQVLIDRPGEVRVVSESGRYLMENVPVGGWLVPFDDLAYLRFIDRSNQKQVYRTPLFSQISLDMRDYEDDGSVGIVWISLFKADGHIEIAMPNWDPIGSTTSSAIRPMTWPTSRPIAASRKTPCASSGMC